MDPLGNVGSLQVARQLERCKLLIQWEPPGWSYHHHHCKRGMVEKQEEPLNQLCHRAWAESSRGAPTTGATSKNKHGILPAHPHHTVK